MLLFASGIPSNSLTLGKIFMAMKKAASMGSDRGAKMKADAAQKKSQQKAGMTIAQKKAAGLLPKNDLAGYRGQPSTSTGRTDTRVINMEKRKAKKLAKKSEVKRQVMAVEKKRKIERKGL